MNIEVSNGELLDKLSILNIKLRMIADVEKLSNVQKEYELVRFAVSQLQSPLAEEWYQLLHINEKLWDVENQLREKECLQEFDGQFIALARQVYLLNDKRAAIKKIINTKTNSTLIEEKGYTA